MHRGVAGRYEYELLFDGEDSEPHLMGLINVEKLAYDTNRSEQKNNQSAPGQPLVRGRSASKNPPQPINGKALEESGPELLKSTPSLKKIDESCHSHSLV